MITLTCTKCRATLEMDEAFAGGVCRCQHCGTIQTVPSHLKHGNKAGAPAGAAGKSLYGGRGNTAGGLPSSGLDDLASAVAGSGISSGLSHRRPTPGRAVEYAAPGARPARNRTPLLIGLLIVGLAVVGLLVWLLVSRPPATPGPVTGGPQPAPTGGQQAVTPAEVGPHFLALPLDVQRVVYVLDRGQSNAEVFDPLKAALFDSLSSLGAGREFQVLFWTSPGSKNADEFAYPKSGTARGNPDRVADIRKEIEDLSITNATEVNAAIREAMKRNPDVVVIATAKGVNLTDDFVKQVKGAAKGNKVVIHTVDLSRSGDGQSAMEAVSRATGGQYVHVTPGELRAR
jgi:hypothetical protein